jgi:nucleoside-diphosphate-sugar epimerase
MKILITSKNGYIATNLYNWLIKIHPYFQIEKKSIRNGLIPSLKKYDVVIHTAGLVHKNELMTPLSTYLKVNRDLTIELANNCKENGVKHFIFLSSMSVYGVPANLDKKVIITKDTPLNPSTSYGKSKLLAETGLLALESPYFKVAILRPPMVYGLGAPGNYKYLSAIAKTTPIFPLIENERSILNISNLCQIINLIITFKSTGLFFPQDLDYMNTSNLVRSLSEKGKFLYMSQILGTGVKILDISIIRKIFGNLVYDKSLSNHFDGKYLVYPANEGRTKKISKISIDL